MARVREFNPEEALDKAMRLFWRKGYAETSMRDLVAETGVAHAGLYGAFGSKRELYQKALKHYDATYGDMLFVPLEDPDSGRREVEGFFATVLNAVETGRWDDGCFMCNTAIEFGNDAHDILSSAAHNTDRMTAAMRGALTRARERGEVRADLDVDETASFLASTFYGLAVFARSKSPKKRIKQSIHAALRVLD